jgi:hypothetical protein
MNNIYRAHAQSASLKVSRGFKTTDLAIMVALILIVASVSGGIVSEAFEDVRPHYAALEVEHLATNLSQSEIARTHSTDSPSSIASKSRIPASVNDAQTSEIALDPWGTPYRYRIFKTPNGQTNVVVLSAGPNKKFESELIQNDTPSHKFIGDDIGFVYESSNQKVQ